MKKSEVVQVSSAGGGEMKHPETDNLMRTNRPKRLNRANLKLQAARVTDIDLYKFAYKLV